MKHVRQAAVRRLTRWAARRHGTDLLPFTIVRRRIYIVPTRFGIALALLLVAMLIAGLNYNSNLGLAFAFLMASLALVAMHHSHRNLLSLTLNVADEADAFAGEWARFDFVLRNDAAVERWGIEVRSTGWSATPEPTAGNAAARDSARPESEDGAVPGNATSGGCAGATQHVPAKAPARGTLALPVPRRGVYRLDDIEVRTRHPFGWFRAWTYVHHPLMAFVAPAPRGDHALSTTTAADGKASQLEKRGDEDFAGLRAYEPGVPLKHMAWKVLARGGEAAVRSYTAMGGEPEWLDWSTLSELDLESRLSQLCLWVLQHEAARRPYGLRIPGTEISPAHGSSHRSACLRALARYGTAVESKGTSL